MNLTYLKALRLLELQCVLPEIRRTTPDAISILEIGAGPGWQSRNLAENGYVVASIDIDSSDYATDREWPITDYDGRQIPFSDQSFDIVFSSSVLEHIPPRH